MGANQMTDFSHLNALQDRLFREQSRLAAATNANERAFREREIASCEREIAGEYKYLGIEPVALDDISDDELLAALAA